MRRGGKKQVESRKRIEERMKGCCNIKRIAGRWIRLETKSSKIGGKSVQLSVRPSLGTPEVFEGPCEGSEGCPKETAGRTYSI